MKPTLYCAHCGPSSEAQAKALPEVGETLAAQLVNLSRHPTPWDCELMASNLEGARRAVLRLAAALRNEQTPPDAA